MMYLQLRHLKDTVFFLSGNQLLFCNKLLNNKLLLSFFKMERAIEVIYNKLSPKRRLPYATSPTNTKCCGFNVFKDEKLTTIQANLSLTLNKLFWKN